MLIGAGYVLIFLLFSYFWSSMYRYSGVVSWHPATGLSFGLMLVLGPVWSPLIFLTEMISWAWIFRLPVGLTGVLTTLLSTLAYAGAAALLRRLVGERRGVARLRETTFLLFTAVLTALVSAFLTAQLMVAGGILPRMFLGNALTYFWIWEAYSNVIFSPLFMLLVMGLMRRSEASKQSDLRERLAGYLKTNTAPTLQAAVLLFTILWMVLMLVNLDDWRVWFMVFLPMVLVIYRYGMPGAVISISLISVVALLLAIVSRYPQGDYNNLVLFLLLISMAGLMMGAAFTERGAAEKALRRRLGAEEMLSRISSRFINVQQGNLDEEFRRAMGDICTYCGVDASHLMLFGRDYWITKVYEWLADGIQPGVQQMEGSSMTSLPWMLAELEAGKVVHVPSVDHLPAGADHERLHFQRENLRSLVTVPLHINQVLVGSLGFHSQSGEKVWLAEDIRLLQLVSQIFLNVIERSRAEARMRESDLKFRSLIVQSYDGVLMVDEMGRITEWNHGMERISGRRRSETLGRFIWDVQFEMMPPENRTTQMQANLKEKVLQMLATGTGPGLNRVNEFRAVRANGVPRLLQTLTYPIKSNVIMLGAFVRDMTDVRLGEEELRRSQANLAEAERLAHMGHFRFQVSDGMMEWSEETYRIAGWEPALPPPALDRILPYVIPEDRESVAEAVRNVLMSRQPQALEYRIAIPNSTTRMIYSVVRPELNSNGDVTHIFGTVMDITERKQAEEALRESELRYKELADAVSDTFFGLDWEMRITYWNPASEQLTRLSAAEAVGKDVYTVFPELRGSTAEQFTLEAYRTHAHQGFVIEWPSRERLRYMEVNIYPGKHGFSVFLRDVTERQLANERLRQSEARYRAVVEDQADMISRYTVDGIMTFVNESYCRVMGFNRSEVIGKRFYTFRVAFGKQEPAGEYCLLVGNPEPMVYESQELLADGKEHWIQWVDRPILDDQNRVVEFQSVGRDISESKRLEEELRYLSTHDVLTGLYNRAFFETELRRFQNSRYYPISILMADVNGLKSTNDSQGHASGDELLQIAARVLSSSFRPEDILARFGGDEFAVLLPGLDRSAADEVLQRLRRAQDQYNQNGGPVRLSLSIGIATARRGELLVDVLWQADRRMYQDKSRQKTTRDLKPTA